MVGFDHNLGKAYEPDMGGIDTTPLFQHAIDIDISADGLKEWVRHWPDISGRILL